MMIPSYAPSQEVSYGFKKMSIDSIVDLSNIVDLTNDDDDNTPDINVPMATLKEVASVAQIFEEFVLLVGTFLKLGKEIIVLYEKAMHNKELCGFFKEM